MNKIFFFHHPPKPTKTKWGTQVPGRVPFDVIGKVVSEEEEKERNVTIFADGFGKNMLGPNQDPCVFASPLNVFHSFCKLDAIGYGRDLNKFIVYRISTDGQTWKNSKNILSSTVEPDDIILYGSLEVRKSNFRKICIDTVMVVDSSIVWPTIKVRRTRKPYQLCECDSFLTELLGVSWRSSDAWRNNLKDIRYNHKLTAHQFHKIILGKVGNSIQDVQRLRSSFVPIPQDGATEPISFYENDLSDDIHKRITHMLNEVSELKTSVKPIVELHEDVGRYLIKQLLKKSGNTVVIPPCRVCK